MKNRLPEYFEPSEAEIKEIWNNATIVLDANVLLNLFRYSKASRDELIKIVKHYKDRLWLPYQVAFEFLENSEGVPSSLSKVLNETLKSIDSIYGTIEAQLKLNDYDKYHLLKPTELRNDIKKFQESLRKRVEKIRSEYDTVDKKGIVKQVTEIFDGKVGEDYPEDKLEQLFKEGEKRFKDKTPPGYKDLEDKKGAPKRHLYGDFIWWMQAIDFAKANHCNLVIVTDDSKEDWWYKVEHETKSPRVELIKEFAQLTDGQSFHMYRTGRFMELAKKYDKVTISEKSIKEVKGTTAINYGHLFGGITQPLDSSIWGITGLQSIGDASIPVVGSELHSFINPAISGYIKAQETLKGSLASQIVAPTAGSTINDILTGYRTISPADYLTIGTSSDKSKDK